MNKNSAKKTNNISPVRKKIIDNKQKGEETNLKHKKMSQKEFQKQMESFKAWENKKKEKIDKLKSEKLKKQKNLLKNNIHRNKKMSAEKNDSLLDRLYFKDIRKRKEKHEYLLSLYTPSFAPHIEPNSLYGSARKSLQKKKIRIRNNSMENYYKSNSSTIEKGSTISNNEKKLKIFYGNNNNIHPFVDDYIIEKKCYRISYMKVNTNAKNNKLKSRNRSCVSGELETFNVGNGNVIVDAIRDKLFKKKKSILK
jgi:hypothetical protein